MRNALLPITRVRPPRQLTMALDAAPVKGLSALERGAVIEPGSPADGSGRCRVRGGSR